MTDNVRAYGITKEEKPMAKMTIDEAISIIATNDVTKLERGSVDRYEARQLIEESDITLSVDKYTLKIDERDVIYTVVKNENSGDYYCSLDCEFVYKRSVKDSMLSVGVRDKKTGTVVLMYMDFDKKKDDSYKTALFYPEFYIYQGEKERNYINYSTHYFYYQPNYIQVEAKTIEFLQEIKVNGEGKDVFVIGFTSPTSNEEDKVYLYKTKVIE